MILEFAYRLFLYLAYALTCKAESLTDLFQSHLLASDTEERLDDISFASLLSPELTTICQPIKEMAEKAVELVVNNELPGMTSGKFIFPVALAARQTTK